MPSDMLWRLMVEDIQAAADVFRPVYDKTRGKDGYVSIEVSPTLANNPRGTIAMAEDLRNRCKRPNVMVKIPATKEGLPASGKPEELMNAAGISARHIVAAATKLLAAK